MKKIIFITLFTLIGYFASAQNYDKGLLIYRLTTAQRTALPANTAAGILIYDTTTKSLWVNNGTSWVGVGSGGSGGGKFIDGSTATDAVYTAGNVGIGTTSPSSKLDVDGYIKVGSSDATADAAPAGGMIRYNSATSTFQGYDGTTWVDLN